MMSDERILAECVTCIAATILGYTEQDGYSELNELAERAAGYASRVGFKAPLVIEHLSRDITAIRLDDPVGGKAICALTIRETEVPTSDPDSGAMLKTSLFKAKRDTIEAWAALWRAALTDVTLPATAPTASKPRRRKTPVQRGPLNITEREKRAGELLASGHSHKQIAGEMKVTTGRVSQLVKGVKTKTRAMLLVAQSRQSVHAHKLPEGRDGESLV